MRRQVTSARPRASGTEPRAPSKGRHVYDEIKAAILSGQLPPGSSIDKAALCERLAMSRFPVTAAISRLAYERLVVVQPQHGSFVAKIALGDVLECMMIRSAIEGEVAARAAAARPDGLADDLARNLRAQSAALAASDRDAFYALDLAFHDAILDRLKLGHTGSVLEPLRSHLERTRRMVAAPPGRMHATFEEHQAVAAAIESGNAEVARDAMRRHLAQTTAVIETFARQNPALFSDRP